MRLVQHLAVPVALLGLAVTACGGSDSSSSSGGAGRSGGASSGVATCAQGSIKVSGSTALQPLVQKAATAYQAKCSGANVTVAGGGSSTGLANVAGGTSDIGDSDVPVSNAKSIDPSSVTDHQVAVVIFAVVVNPKTNVTQLTTQQIQDIFSGKVTNWKDVGGADLPISVILRKPGSGTRLTFDKTVMKGTAELSNPSSTQDSTSLVVQGVQQSDGGVSYINVASAKGVTPVAIDGNKPDAPTLAAGKYPFYSHEHMYTKASGASPLAQDFINYILSADFQPQLTQLGFVLPSVTTQQSAVDR